VQRTPGVTSGNAAVDGVGRNGWLLGDFFPDGDHPLATPEVEVKWAVYGGGETRDGWGVNDRAHTLALLVRGRFRLRFPEREVLLAQEGDYVLWEPGVQHYWQAEGPAVVVTVRWPSLPEDSRSAGDGCRVPGVG
jgi:hypothetical protein